MSVPSLHSRLAELVAFLNETRTELLAVMSTVRPSEERRCPCPDAWSPAQIAEHLRLVEDGLGRVLGGLVKRTDPASLGSETETASVLGALDRHGLAERRSRLPAPAMVTPSADADLASALAALAESRRRLLALVDRVSGLAVGRLTFPHPMLGPLSFYELLLFIGQHERRHTAQAREVLELLRSQSGGRSAEAHKFAGIGLAAVTALVAAAPALAQESGAPLPYETMARRIVSALEPAKGERAILRTDGIAMPELVPPLRDALEQAGAEVTVLGFDPSLDLKGELDRSTIYVWLPLAPATTVPPPDAVALGRWLDSGRGRQVHFHWTGITTGTDGLAVPVPASFDQLHLAALDASEGALRHRLTRAAELLRGNEVRVATAAGTDLRFRIDDRPICLQDGNASQAAVSGKPLRIDKEIELPAGVLRVAPIERSVNGTLVIPMLRVGVDTARMVQLDFTEGFVTDVRAESGAEAVRAMLAETPALTGFRELGIGFNPALVVPADQPAIPYAGYGAGMVRLSLGDNGELGGRRAGTAARWLFFPDAIVVAGSTLLVDRGRLAL